MRKRNDSRNSKLAVVQIGLQKFATNYAAKKSAAYPPASQLLYQRRSSEENENSLASREVATV